MNTPATQLTAVPEPEQMAAIVRFAQRHGRSWKSALRDAWASGKDDSMPDGPLLRQVRNQLGPNWLQTFVLSPSASNEGVAAVQKGIFSTPYTQHADRKGQAFTVLGVVDPATYDVGECGVMYRIQFEDGAEVHAWPEEVGSALEPLSIETVQTLLANCDEPCSASRIGFYPDVEALVEKVRSSKCWAEGEVFVAAESIDRYVIMKQVAPASCEMMTLTNSGFLDVYTAYRMDAAELIDVLNGAMSKNSAAGDRPRA